MNSILRSIRNFWELISAECLHAHRDPDIADAAYDSDLAAVRGHLRRDRRCLDQLFDGLAALHCATGRDRTGAIVAFLLAQGAAVDVVDEFGPGAQAPPWSCRQVVPPSAAAEIGLRCILQQSTASRRTPGCCWLRRPRWTARISPAGSLSRCHNRVGKRFFTGKRVE